MHLVRATLGHGRLYMHCGLTLDRPVPLTVVICEGCVRGKRGHDQRVQDSYTELATRRATDVNPFTRD